MDEISTKPAKERIKLHQKFHSEVMKFLRKCFAWSGIITVAKAKARVKRGVYECELCHNFIGPKEFDIDHIDPVIPLDENWTTGYCYNGIVERLMDMENVQLICKICHRKKCGQENSERQTGVPRRPSTKKKLKKTYNTPEMKEMSALKRRGKKHSKASKKKMSISSSGNTGFLSKLSGGEYYTENGLFGSMEDAAKANNCSTMAVMSRCYKYHNNGRPTSDRHREKFKDWKFIPKK